jgi:hypothetical protein
VVRDVDEGAAAVRNIQQICREQCRRRFEQLSQVQRMADGYLGIYGLISRTQVAIDVPVSSQLHYQREKP